MWDSDCQSIFSDASDSDTGSVFSDGGSLCDEMFPVINPTMNQLKIAPEKSLVKTDPVCFQAQSPHLKKSSRLFDVAWKKARLQHNHCRI